jgi:cytochrome d ubiquinol oxidase subunit I
VIALEGMRKNPQDEAARAAFKAHEKDLGYGLLVKKYVEDPRQATPEIIHKAARFGAAHAPLFWSFRVMVGLGIAMLALMVVAFWHSVKGSSRTSPGCSNGRSIPSLPWIAIEAGWFVADTAAAVDGVWRAAHPPLGLQPVGGEPVGSIAGFVGFYSLLLVAEMYLMFKYARLGPSVLHAKTA